jgi:hypothetical protein
MIGRESAPEPLSTGCDGRLGGCDQGESGAVCSPDSADAPEADAPEADAPEAGEIEAGETEAGATGSGPSLCPFPACGSRFGQAWVGAGADDGSPCRGIGMVAGGGTGTWAGGGTGIGRSEG